MPRKMEIDMAEGYRYCKERDQSRYNVGDYKPGRSKPICVFWYFISLFFFENGWFPLYSLKLNLLRAFGAKVGKGVVIKPHVRIKYPWRLAVGDYAWIGQGVWIDNLSDVEIGSHVCVSQGTYFCTGSHDWRSEDFELITRKIVVEDFAWITAFSVLLGGTKVERCRVYSSR